MPARRSLLMAEKDVVTSRHVRLELKNPQSRLWAGVALGLAAGVIAVQVAFQLALARPAFRKWLQGELEREMGGAVSFGLMDGSVFSVHLHDFAFEARGRSLVQSLKARRLSASVGWWAFLGERRIVPHSVSADGAVVRLRIFDGRPQLALPLVPRRLRLSNSEVRVRNLSGWRAVLEGVDAVLDEERNDGTNALTGRLRAGRATVGLLVLDDLESRVSLGDGHLEVESMEARMYRGTLRASGRLDLKEPQTLHAFAVGIENAGVLASLEALGYSDRFAGAFRLDFTGEGQLTPSIRDLQGHGTLGLASFRANVEWPHPKFVGMEPLLQELRQVRDLAGGARLVLRGDRIELTDLSLRNADLTINGAGHVGFDGTLDVQCVSLLGERIASKVPGMAKKTFARGEDGRLIVPFRIKETLAEPKVEAGSLPGGILRSLKNLFRFGR